MASAPDLSGTVALVAGATRGAGRGIAVALGEAGADSFGPALHMDGVCAPAVEVPADADRNVRALARLGRAV